MTKQKYQVGYKFNNLTIIEYLGKKKGTRNYYYRCKCGKEINIATFHIVLRYFIRLNAIVIIT